VPAPAVLAAFGGAVWEADLIARLDTSPTVTLVRRCVDVVDLLSVAASGQAQAALLSADLRRLDVDAIDRLRAVDVVPVGVTTPAGADEAAFLVVGVRHVVPADAPPEVIATVVLAALEEASANSMGFSNPVAASAAIVPPSGRPGPPIPTGARGTVIAVWGPTGAPGRTTIAVNLADAFARLDRSALLVDADSYGGVVAAVLGLLDESPGLAAACRAAAATRLDSAGLAALCWQLGERLRVLTGIPLAERWPELRPTAIPAVLAAARELADVTVIDCAFALEADEELSYDTVAPRRNGATLTALADADLILAVGSADSIGIQRLVRGLSDLHDADIGTPVWIVLNRVRTAVVPGRPEDQLAAALKRFAGRTPAGYLPLDQESLDAALAAGKTLAEARPSSRLRRAIAELAVAIAGGGNDGGRSARHRGPVDRFARAGRRAG
jgi:MinD-like ATPase involved in chromosome partitioning or flagellar assembly